MSSARTGEGPTNAARWVSRLWSCAEPIRRPLIAQLVEDRFALWRYAEPERGDLQAFAASDKGIFVAACLETERRRPSSDALSAPPAMAGIAKSRMGRTSS